MYDLESKLEILSIKGQTSISPEEFEKMRRAAKPQAEEGKKGASGSKENSGEREASTTIVPYHAMLKDLEAYKEKTAAAIAELVKKQGLIITNLKNIQKVITEKFKFKFKLEGLDDEGEDKTKEPAFAKEATIRKSAMGNGNFANANQALMSRIEHLEELDAKVDILSKESAKHANKDAFEHLEQHVKVLQNAILAKVDRSKLDSMQEGVNNEIKKLEASITGVILDNVEAKKAFAVICVEQAEIKTFVGGSKEKVTKAKN